MSDQNPPPSSGGFSMDPKEAKANAKAQEAHAKALRPWYKKKRFMIPLVLVVIFGLMTAASGGGDDKKDDTASPSGDNTGTTEADTGDKILFPGRADAQDEDQERNIGDSAELSGYTATVTAAAFQQSISDFEESGYVVTDVTIENRDDAAQSYNTFDWKLQTPEGQVIDPGFTTIDTIGSGDLVSGGTVSGKVVFEVGVTKGDFYIIYKPNPFDGARAIWKVTVP